MHEELVQFSRAISFVFSPLANLGYLSPSSTVRRKTCSISGMPDGTGAEWQERPLSIFWNFRFFEFLNFARQIIKRWSKFVRVSGNQLVAYPFSPFAGKEPLNFSVFRLLLPSPIFNSYTFLDIILRSCSFCFKHPFENVSKIRRGNRKKKKKKK